MKTLTDLLAAPCTFPACRFLGIDPGSPSRVVLLGVSETVHDDTADLRVSLRRAQLALPTTLSGRWIPDTIRAVAVDYAPMPALAQRLVEQARAGWAVTWGRPQNHDGFLEAVSPLRLRAPRARVLHHLVRPLGCAPGWEEADALAALAALRWLTLPAHREVALPLGALFYPAPQAASQAPDPSWGRGGGRGRPGTS